MGGSDSGEEDEGDGRLMEMFRDLPEWIQWLIPWATAVAILVGSLWAVLSFAKFIIKVARSDKSGLD